MNGTNKIQKLGELIRFRKVLLSSIKPIENKNFSIYVTKSLVVT